MLAVGWMSVKNTRKIYEGREETLNLRIWVTNWVECASKRSLQIRSEFYVETRLSFMRYRTFRTEIALTL